LDIREKRIMIQDSLVSVVAAYRLDDWHSVAKRGSGFSILTISRRASCVHWPPIQWVPKTLSLGDRVVRV
jgi:hypothetical protein